MTPDELLQQLEPLTHDARMRRMVEIGRLATRDTSVAATLNALENGGFYERWLAQSVLLRKPQRCPCAACLCRSVLCRPFFCPTLTYFTKKVYKLYGVTELIVSA